MIAVRHRRRTCAGMISFAGPAVCSRSQQQQLRCSLCCCWL
jgi:hypothetical protein